MNRKMGAGVSGQFLPVLACLGVAAAALAPGHLHAQACLGNPALPGETALQGSVTVNDDATGYGGDIRVNMRGRVAAGIGGAVIDVDGLDRNIRSLRTDVSLDLAAIREFAACPVVGVSYSAWRDDFFETTLELSELRVPFGLGVGPRFELDRVIVIIPSGVVGGYWYRREGTFEIFDPDLMTAEERETGTEFFAEAGATLGLGQLYLRGAVLWDGRDETDTAYRFTMGFVF